MQTELFEKNAVLITRTDEQVLLYTDILSANGFAVKSVMQQNLLKDVLSHSTDIILIDFADDIIDEVQAIINELNLNIPIVYISIDDKLPETLNCLSLAKPILIDTLLETIHKAVYCNDNKVIEQCEQIQQY